MSYCRYICTICNPIHNQEGTFAIRIHHIYKLFDSEFEEKGMFDCRRICIESNRRYNREDIAEDDIFQL